jgi:hypothetical protein
MERRKFESVLEIDFYVKTIPYLGDVVDRFRGHGQEIRFIRAPGNPTVGIVNEAILGELVVAIRELFLSVGHPCRMCFSQNFASNRRFRKLHTQGRLPAAKWSPWAMGALAAYSGEDDTESGWSGHLIAVVDDRWVVDSTLDYLLARTFRVAPIVAEAGNEFIREQRCSLNLDDIIISYRRDDSNQRCFNTPAWCDGDERMERYFHVLGTCPQIAPPRRFN